MSKILEKAIKAKEQGYTHMASIVKNVYSTNYYNVVLIDDIIRLGMWIPANYVQFSSGARGRIGINGNNIDWTKTIRK